MKNSREIIMQTLRLIIVALGVILFLESDSCELIRRFVASNISFLQGKRETISNIFIGILGSAILMVFGEFINYFQEKRRLEVEILRLYQKWDKKLRELDGMVIESELYLDHIPSEIIYFGNQVADIYNKYLPYIRGGRYFQLIRVLFRYTNEIQEYLEKIENRDNEVQYFSKCREQLNALKIDCANEKICKKIDQNMEMCEKRIVELKEQKMDKKYILESINKARRDVVEKSATAEVLFMHYKFNSLDKKDEEFEMKEQIYRVKKTMRKADKMMKKVKRY